VDWLAILSSIRGKKDIWLGLEEIYGKKKAAVWFYQWQVFYIACGELFAWEGGDTWGVCH